MKPLIFSALVAVGLAGGILSTHAQTNTPAATATAPSAEDRDAATADKHAKPILEALNLNDAGKEAKVRAAVFAQVKALDAWHTDNDAQIKADWAEFDQARKKKDKAGADAALDKIDGVYASFKPQHDKFIADLSAVLTPAQVETVEDSLTVKKVEVTYHSYLEIFPTLTDEQKAMVLKYLKEAREQAIDAKTMTEKSAFFKKYKVKIEDDYLTSQGYNPQQARKDFAAKQKAAGGTKAEQ